MSDSQHHALHNADLDAADVSAGRHIGRGTGFTLKEVSARLRAFFKKRAMPSRVWRTLAQKQALVRRRDRVNLRAAQQHRLHNDGIQLKRFTKDAWRQL